MKCGNPLACWEGFLYTVFMRSRALHSKLSLVFILGTLLFTYGAFTAFAVPPVSPYTPGAVLDPACAPGTLNCTVKILYDLYAENPVAGFTVPVATGDNAVALGDGSVASGAGAIALGAADPATFLTSAPIASGDNSFATGTGTEATNAGATAMGVDTTASGQISFAAGFNAVASGDVSFSLGEGTIASAYRSIAFGNNTVASGNTAAAFGTSADATGSSSFALGENTVASGDTSFAAGALTTASGLRSTAFGFDTAAPSFAETVFGMYTTQYAAAGAASLDLNDRLFSIGNGTLFARNNALTIIKDGTFILNDDDTIWTSGEETKMFFDVVNQAFRVGTVDGIEWEGANLGVNSIALGFSSGGDAAPIASGVNSTAFGLATVASTDYATAFGLLTVASGQTSTAFGNSTIASGVDSTAFGNSTTASGNSSIAFGETSFATADRAIVGGYLSSANGIGSVAFGVGASADGGGSVAIGSSAGAAGEESIAIGQGASSLSYGEVALGVQNTNYVPDNVAAFDLDDRLLVVGNGDGSPGGSDAFTILKDGRVGVGIDNFENTASPEILQVGTNAIAGAVARFTNSAGFCTINPVTTTLNCTSDETLKKNIVSFDTALDSIMRLRPVTYRWNAQSDDAVKTPGFIAQEVEQVLPELVSIDEGTGLRTLSTSSLIPYLTKAVQELNDKINTISAGTAAGTQVGELVVDTLKARRGEFTETLCVGTVCVDEAMLSELLDNAGIDPTPEPEVVSEPDPEPTPDQTPSPDPITEPAPESAV